MLTVLLGIGTGFILSFQTAINSQLRKYVISPFLASMVSFLVALVFLAITTIIIGSTSGFSFSLILNQPIWIWFGGICGVIGLTTNILLFPKLGSVETAVMPIIGTIIMGMLIDHFGWFHSMEKPFSMYRILGIILVLSGVILTVVIPELRTKLYSSSAIKKNKLSQYIWRLTGVIAGMFISIQAAINGQLGGALNSPIYAALVSFFIGSVTLIILVGFKERTFVNVKKPVKQSAPWWIWIGGIIGATYVLINVFLVGKIGTGQTIVLALFGQIAGSLIVEQFGLLKSVKNPIVPIQVVGLLIMLSGVIFIKLF